MAIETPRFPEKIMEGALASVIWSTGVVSYGSGTESRNANWQYPLKRFDIPNVDDKDVIRVIQDWFMVTQGAYNSFRVKDHTDYKSTSSMDDTVTNLDQTIGTGDGVTTAFQIVKNYAVGGNTISRKITKIVSGSLVVAVGGVAQTGTGSPHDYDVDLDTGIITFTYAPGATSPITTPSITCGYEFDVPVRFQDDQLDIRLITLSSHSIDNLPLIEVR